MPRGRWRVRHRALAPMPEHMADAVAAICGARTPDGGVASGVLKVIGERLEVYFAVAVGERAANEVVSQLGVPGQAGAAQVGSDCAAGYDSFAAVAVVAVAAGDLAEGLRRRAEVG